MIRALRVETVGGTSVFVEFRSDRQDFRMTFVDDSGPGQDIHGSKALLENARLALDVFLKDMGE